MKTSTEYTLARAFKTAREFLEESNSPSDPQKTYDELLALAFKAYIEARRHSDRITHVAMHPATLADVYAAYTSGVFGGSYDNEPRLYGALCVADQTKSPGEFEFLIGVPKTEEVIACDFNPISHEQSK